MSEFAKTTTIRPVLRVVVLHGDAAADQHAATLIRIVETMFHETAEVCVKRWSFHQLERLDVRAMASHHGKDVVILMVCSSSGQSIPHTVASWMERTYQSPHCLKPLIIRFEQGAVSKEDITCKLASAWKVPLAYGFSMEATSCWGNIREFVEDRLRSIQDLGEDDSESEFARQSPARPPSQTKTAPMDQAIRDQAYYLWVNAGRPDGRNLDFWHQAEQKAHMDQALFKKQSPF